MSYPAPRRKKADKPGKKRDLNTMPADEVRNECSRLKTVRLRLADRHPFWGFLLLHARLVPALELPAFAATDCVRNIWFNPRLTRHLNRDQLAFVLCHEVGHMLLASAPRRHGRDPHLWNCATDYAINRIVNKIQLSTHPYGRIQTPDGVYPELGHVEILHDAKYDGLIAETIYEHLVKEQPRGEGLTITVVLPGAGEGGADIEVQVQGHANGRIDVHVPAALSDEEREDLADRVQAAIEARKVADGRGHLPGEALRALGLLQQSAVPWQRVLHRYAGECLGRLEYTRTRPNRRFMALDVVVPGLMREGPGRLVVAVDTSASMDTKVLEQAAAELAALAALVPEVTTLIGDAKVQEVVPTHQLGAFLKKRRFRGGGGTDHRPIFAWIAQQAEPPELFVGITDLWSRFPRQRPPFPVLWIAPQDHGNVPWGEVVTVG